MGTREVAQENGKKGGRPIGAVTTPQGLLRAEMKACAATARIVRQLVEEQVAEIRKYLATGTQVSLDERLKAIDSCTTVLEKLQKTMDGGAKLLVTKESNAGESSSGGGVAEFLKSITGDEKG
jgi:hypothetical protein